MTLIEPNRIFVACPFSNEVIAGLRDIEAQQFGYDRIAAEGVTVIAQAATKVDAQARTVGLADGTSLGYDRLVLAPGIDLRFDALPGYDEAAATKMPHAWKAGEQTALLRRQLEAMDDGGLVVLAVPAGPSRCPPAPYERASLIAHYLKTKKPRSKILILDAKDAFPQQRLFENAWKELYPGMIERVSLSQGGRVTSVDPATNTIVTDFGNYTAEVANVIPPQKAGRIADIAGAVDNTGWCPIDPVTFASKLVPDIHVIGDACFGGTIPKSASAANAQGKACAEAIVKLIAGKAAGYAAAGRRLLQHGRARLRLLAIGRLSGPRTACSPKPRQSPPARSMRRASCARGKPTRRKPGTRPSRWMPLARSDSNGRCVARGGGIRPALRGRAMQDCGAMSSSATPSRQSLTGAPGDAARGRALVLDRSSAPASSATPGRSRKPGFRAISRPTSQAPAAAGRKASSGCGWSMPRSLNPATIMPSYYRVEGLAARRHGMARQADPVGGTDRGYRGVSRKPARLGTNQRCASTTNSTPPPVPRPRRQRGRARRGSRRDAAAGGRDAGDARHRDPQRRRRAPWCAPARSSSTFRRWSRTATPCR